MNRYTRTRLIRIALALAGVMLLAGIAGVLVVRSQWFYDKVRREIVAQVEKATGGRAEIQQFHFDWTRLRAEVRKFTLHGTEPANKPPLFTASSVAIGLRIVSLFKRQVDLQYLDVVDPRIYVIIHRDGSTNVPEPKLKRSEKGTIETILQLAISRFLLQNGVFEIESRQRTEFDARGQNLSAQFLYDVAGPRYRGRLAFQPLDLKIPEQPLAPVDFSTDLVIEKNRVEFSGARIATADSAVDLSGTLEDFARPRLTVRYNARASVVEAARLLKIDELKAGTAHVEGAATWSEGPGLETKARVQAEHVDYRDSTLRLRDWRAAGDLALAPDGVDLNRMQLGGTLLADYGSLPASGQISEVTIRGRDLSFRGVALQALGGTFRGEAQLRNLSRLTTQGEIQNFLARQTVGLYSKQSLPWDARVSGTAGVDVTLGRKQSLKVKLDLALAPAPESSPVEGRITANYDAATKVLDLGRSTVMLPHSRADFSGAIGRSLRVHAETTDLGDILPVFGEDPAAFPVKVQGAAVFYGSVNGNLERPLINGRIHAQRFTVQGNPVDSLEGAVTASPDNVRMQSATVTRGVLSARFQAAVDLQNWKTSDASRIFGDASIRNAPLVELTALANRADVRVSGTVSANTQFSGTIGNPLLKGDVDVTKGVLYDEPFDRLTARVDYGGNRAEVVDVQLTAGARQVRLAANYQFTAGRPDTGRLHFQIASNSLPLDQIQTLVKSRPGVKGTARITASGDVDLFGIGSNDQDLRVLSLQADVAGENLQVTGQPLGNAHLVANSEGQTLKARVDATFADSRLRGDGEWSLNGDYPGSATVSFTRLDLAQLRSWLSAPTASTNRFAGFAEGEFKISGPLRKTEALRAQLMIPKFAIGSRPGGGTNVEYSLENAGPLVATLANSVVTIDSARFTGRESDLALGGRITLQPKTALDLRTDGRIGLALLRDFDSDIEASGVVTADATIRGDFQNPQVNGRMQLNNAAFSLADVPNGISRASGVIIFNKDRATIQSLKGETGGGSVELSGFFAYSAASPIFNIAAKATHVRVRYPEGVSTVANANLTWIGNVERSRVGGTVTVVRTGFNPQSDFSAILTQSAEPVRTPSTEPGLLGGMTFDVQINTDPDIQFQSDLAENLQVDANLHLRGTPANPAMLGRVNITQGQVLFQGTKFTINQGSISFFNPSKLEPIFDIDLETKARGIDITLTIGGPLNKLNLTPRSDPPLQFQEIVELLATGRTPTSDPSRLAKQDTAPQSFQRMGASALLGQVVTNPVAGRLQRFFGVSKLKIDPTLPGVENNLARLTLEQQVTPDLTFTYITNVTNSNPQVVRVEWSVNKQWSIVALRDESGVLGLDFFFKKRF